MTEEAKLPSAERAWSAYLSGGSFQQVATALDIEPEDVQELLDQAIDKITIDRLDDHDQTTDYERLNALFRVAYPKAIAGDLEASKFCVKISEERRAIRDRAQHVQIPDPKEVPPAVSVRSAWQILAGGASHVAQTLVDISVYGKTESSRVTASIAVLDRVGLSPVNRSEVAVHLMDQGEIEASASQVTGAQLVRQRLDQIKKRQIEAIQETDGYEYIDAETEA